MDGSRPRLSTLRGGAVPFMALALAACGGPSGSMRKDLNASIAGRDWAAAEKKVVSAKESSYGRKNQVLYYLDLGAVQHDAGKFKESDESLDKAERRMEELYTKSVTRAAGTLMLNDATTEYAGERFERALLNAYRALNYTFLGRREDALVEVRKLSRLLQEYADVYGAKSTAYSDDAFAQFLASLLYADDGRPDDARIAREKSAKAYESWRKAYGTPVPRLEPAGERQDAGELVFLHYNGVAPRKVSKVFSVAWREALTHLDATQDDEAQAGRARRALASGLTAGKAIAVAFPDYVQDPFQISGSVVESGGLSVPTELASDISAIARKDLEERLGVIRARAIARATIKFILAKAASDAVAKKYGKNSWQAMLTQAGGAVASVASETADTRAWAALPAQFRVARLYLPPGRHDVTVTYTGPSGATLSTQVFTGVTVFKGRRTYLHDRTAL